jgi:hypothetical protein
VPSPPRRDFAPVRCEKFPRERRMPCLPGCGSHQTCAPDPFILRCGAQGATSYSGRSPRQYAGYRPLYREKAVALRISARTYSRTELSLNRSSNPARRPMKAPTSRARSKARQSETAAFARRPLHASLAPSAFILRCGAKRRHELLVPHGHRIDAPTHVGLDRKRRGAPFPPRSSPPPAEAPSRECGSPTRPTRREHRRSRLWKCYP